MKKLEVVFSVLLVVALVAPGLSLGQTWVGPVAPFSNLSPAPELPISEGSSKQGKSANISIPQINISGDTEYLQKTQNTLPETNSIMLGFNKGLSWGSNLLSVGSTGFFNFIAEGIKLPSKSGNPSSPVAGTIYYDSNAKEVKLYDGATWKSIGSGAAGGGSSQWSDISGNIAYGFSKTIPSPRHNGLVIKNDKATRDQFCIEDASVADSVKYTLGEGDEIAKGNVTHAYYNGGWSSATGNIAYLSSIICRSGNRVGIGTISPGYALDVNGSINGSQICIAGVCKNAWPGPANPLSIGSWKLSAVVGTGSVNVLDFSAPDAQGGDGGNTLSIQGVNKSGKARVVLAPDTSLCFNGGATGADCKDAWPVAAVGGKTFDGLLQGPDLILKATTTTPNDPGDVVFQDFSGNQKARIWSNPSEVAGLNFSSGDNIPDIVIDDAGRVGVGGAPDASKNYKLDVKSGYINLGDAGSEVMIPGGATLDEGLLVRSGGLVVPIGPVDIGGTELANLNVYGNISVFGKSGLPYQYVYQGLGTLGERPWSETNEANPPLDWWGDEYKNNRIACDAGTRISECADGYISPASDSDPTIKYDLYTGFRKENNTLECTNTNNNCFIQVKIKKFERTTSPGGNLVARQLTLEDPGVNSELRIKSGAQGYWALYQNKDDGSLNLWKDTVYGGKNALTINSDGFVNVKENSLQIGPLVSGANGLVLKSDSGNSPFVSWNNGTQKFGIRSDNDNLYIGVGDASDFLSKITISSSSEIKVDSITSQKGLKGAAWIGYRWAEPGKIISSCNTGWSNDWIALGEMRVDPDGSGEIQGRVGIGRYKGGAYTYQWSGWGGYYGPDSRRGPLVTLGWNTPTDGRQATYYSQPPNIEMKICIRSDGRDDKSYENDCPGSGWGVMEATCKVNDYK